MGVSTSCQSGDDGVWEGGAGGGGAWRSKAARGRVGWGLLDITWWKVTYFQAPRGYSVSIDQYPRKFLVLYCLTLRPRYSGSPPAQAVVPQSLTAASVKASHVMLPLRGTSCFATGAGTPLPSRKLWEGRIRGEERGRVGGHCEPEGLVGREGGLRAEAVGLVYPLGDLQWDGDEGRVLGGEAGRESERCTNMMVQGGCPEVRSACWGGRRQSCRKIAI